MQIIILLVCKDIIYEQNKDIQNCATESIRKVIIFCYIVIGCVPEQINFREKELLLKR